MTIPTVTLNEGDIRVWQVGEKWYWSAIAAIAPKGRQFAINNSNVMLKNGKERSERRAIEAATEVAMKARAEYALREGES